MAGNAAVRFLHELFEPILKVLIPAALRGGRNDAGRARHRMADRLLLPSGARLGLRRLVKGALDGKIDLPLGRDTQELDLDGLPDLYMFVNVADKCVGHFRDVDQTALSAGERDKRPELRDTGNLSLKNLADLPIHGLSSLCLSSPAIRTLRIRLPAQGSA